MKFDVLLKDELISTVEVDGLDVLVTNYENVEYHVQHFLRPFGDRTKVSVNALFDYFEFRSIPRTRSGIDKILKCIGLNEYDPYRIVRITHGTLSDDDVWLRFDDESDLTWDDIKHWKGE